MQEVGVKHDLGGTLRGRDAAATLAWVRPLLPRFGITRLANVTGLDRVGIPVWLCVRPNSRSLSVSQGKGVTHELAQVSAVMESIETYHAERVAAPDYVGSYRSARRRCAAVSPRSLEPGIRWGAFSDNRPVCWIRGSDVTTGEPVLVPHARVSLDWTRPHPDAGLLLASSTGLASGNVRAEAMCHALFEVVERDSEWRWDRLSGAAQERTRLDPGSVGPAMLRALLQQFEQAGLGVAIWDMTSEVGLPTYFCRIADLEQVEIVNVYGGSGCHLSKEIALARALTEAAQSRLTYIAGSRDDTFPESYYRRKHQMAAPSPPSGPLDFRLRCSPRLGRTFEDDLTTALELLRAAAFPRVVVVDHTKPEFGVPVVAVVVPGMHEPDED